MGARQELEALRAEFAEQKAPPLSPREELEMLRAENIPTDQKNQEESFPGAGIIEPALSVASAIPAEIAGGLSTLWPLLTGDPDKAMGNLTAMKALLTYQPDSAEGKQGLADLGEALQPVGDVLQTVEKKFSESGAQTFDALGLNPAIGAGVGAAIPEALAMALGIKPAKTAAKTAVKTTAEGMTQAAGSARDIPKMFTEQSAFKKKIAEDIASGSTDNRLARYVVDGNGKVKSDPVAKEAIKQGYDEGTISAIKASSPVDKAKMLEMLNITKRGKENSRFAADNRASDVAGDSLIDRVNYVKNTNRSAGQDLDRVAKSLKGQAVDSSAPVNNFINSLDDMGVTIGRDFKPRFKGSDVEGLAAPEAAIKNIVKRLSSGPKGRLPDAYELHRMKKYIDEVVTFGKVGEGLSGKTERILKKLRADLDLTLDSNFSNYNGVNTIYADTITALDDLQSVAGKKMNLSGPNANKATGTLLRRMMSNAQSRVNLIDAVKSVEKTANKYGAGFKDDLMTQVLFADELGSKFGAAAKTSLQGDVEKAVRSTRGRTLPDLAADAAIFAAEKARNINDAAAFKAMEDLLKQ